MDLKSKLNKKWEINFIKLKELSEIPKYSKKSEKNINKLAKWCQLQKYKYNKNILSKIYIENLEKINFWKWSDKKTKSNKEKETYLPIYYPVKNTFTPEILHEELLLKWIGLDTFWTKMKYTSTNKTFERDFGSNLIKNYINPNYTGKSNWTTILGEHLIRQLFIMNGHKVYDSRKIENKIPDFETDDYVIEVKTRTYTISGTAGDKVLATPFKYIDIPRLYKKPLKIVVLGYQEFECINKYILFDTSKMSKEKLDTINFFKNHNIEFMKASDLLNFDFK